MKRIYGLHLLADGYVNYRGTLEADPLITMVERLVPALGMRILVPPQATRIGFVPEHLQDDEDEGGWSVFSQITTSHISIQTWPLRSAFMLDIFSCKPFNAEYALKIVYDELNVKVWNTRIVERDDPTVSDQVPKCIVRKGTTGGFRHRCEEKEVEDDEEDTKP
jgi:S-adenosylmethionine decarboxylase